MQTSFTFKNSNPKNSRVLHVGKLLILIQPPEHWKCGYSLRSSRIRPENIETENIEQKIIWLVFQHQKSDALSLVEFSSRTLRTPLCLYHTWTVRFFLFVPRSSRWKMSLACLEKKAKKCSWTLLKAGIKWRQNGAAQSDAFDNSESDGLSYVWVGVFPCI